MSLTELLILLISLGLAPSQTLGKCKLHASWCTAYIEVAMLCLYVYTSWFSSAPSWFYRQFCNQTGKVNELQANIDAVKREVDVLRNASKLLLSHYMLPHIQSMDEWQLCSFFFYSINARLRKLRKITDTMMIFWIVYTLITTETIIRKCPTVLQVVEISVQQLTSLVSVCGKCRAIQVVDSKLQGLIHFTYCWWASCKI